MITCTSKSPALAGVFFFGYLWGLVILPCVGEVFLFCFLLPCHIPILPVPLLSLPPVFVSQAPSWFIFLLLLSLSLPALILLIPLLVQIQRDQNSLGRHFRRAKELLMQLLKPIFIWSLKPNGYQFFIWLFYFVAVLHSKASGSTAKTRRSGFANSG
jgi:hypothetical protein